MNKYHYEVLLARLMALGNKSHFIGLDLFHPWLRRLNLP